MNDFHDAGLLFKSKVWEESEYELVDYENKKYEKKNIKIDSSGIISKINNKIAFYKGKGLNSNFHQILGIIKDDKKGYYINTPIYSKELTKLCDEKPFFLVYKSKYKKKDINLTSKKNCYLLSQGDIIKLGRVFMKVLDIKLTNSIECESENSSSISQGMNYLNSFTSLNDFNVTHSNFKYNKNNLINSLQSIKLGHPIRNKENDELNENNVIFGSFSPGNGNIIKSQMKMNNIRKLETNIRYGKISTSNENNINNFSENENNKFLISNQVNLESTEHCNSTNLIKIKKLNNSFSKNLVINKLVHMSNNNSKNGGLKQYLVRKYLNLKKIKSKKICRICYGDEEESNNPLISPCLCKGSMKYIHYKCLKNWLNSKIESEVNLNNEELEENGITYCTKEIICELCKAKLPDYIRYKGKLYNITFYHPNFSHFIVLESMRNDKNRIKFIHLISLDKKREIRIGRASDCDLSIPELSVSRVHCIIHIDKENLLLEDNNSKFGTLILLQNPRIHMNYSSPLKIQKGKTYCKFKLILPYNFLCCCIPQTFDPKVNSYQYQNQKYFDVFSCFTILEQEEDKDIEGDFDTDLINRLSVASSVKSKNNGNLLNRSFNFCQSFICKSKSKAKKKKKYITSDRIYLEQITNLERQIANRERRLFISRRNEVGSSSTRELFSISRMGNLSRQNIENNIVIRRSVSNSNIRQNISEGNNLRNTLSNNINDVNSHNDQ